jgi:hypothetical protein
MYYRLGTATFTLQISTNGGSSFQQVFSASDHYGNSWENKNVSLAAFADQQVILRLELSIGTYYSGGGVWIDDLSVNSGSWLNWDPFYTDTTLAAHRFSSTVTELDNCDDFSVFQKTSTSTYKDWVCSTTGGVANCFYKEPGGYSNHKYHLTSISTITPTASTRLLLRAKYSLYTDGFQVLVSTDHVNFTQLWSGAGTLDWGDIAIDLGAYADQPIYVRFEYIPAGYYTTGGIWIDTVSLENVTNPEYEGQPIHYTQIPSPAAGMHTLKAVLTDSSLVEHAMGPAFTLSVYDNDGMPVDWEQLYGFDPFVDDSALDLDLDGFSNLDEYIAGTLPDNSNSVFRIGIEGQTIKWPARDDRTYRVLKADEPAGPYSVLQSVEGPVSNYTDNATLLRRFYKVDVGL